MRKSFNNIWFLLALIIVSGSLKTEALEIVYPKSTNVELSAKSTFFIGNTKPNSILKINNKEVKVYENGSFVEVVPLKDGTNEIIVESKNETEQETKTYTIKKVSKSDLATPEPETENFPENQFIYASTIRNNIPLRAEPNENAKRLTHLNNDVMLLLNGKKGDYYRVYLSPTETAWVKSNNIVTYSTINGQMLSSAINVLQSDDKLYEYIKTAVSFQVPYQITETDTGLTVKLFNIKENAGETKEFKTTNTIKNIAINTSKIDTTSTYYIELNHKLWGYDAYYEGNILVLKIRKAPKIDTSNPLKGLTITVDPGHGGNDAGAIGPTGIKEKEINLDISNKLKKELEEQGVQVVLTRTDDSAVELYERPQIAKKSDSLFMLSIHANALPDGADPYKKHGTSVFYYNKEAKELATIIRDTLTKELETQDDGISNCSFVLTRPSMPISVLIEVAYMIHPEEYTLLLDESFRLKAAKAISEALKSYMLNNLNTMSK